MKSDLISLDHLGRRNRVSLLATLARPVKDFIDGIVIGYICCKKSMEKPATVGDRLRNLGHANLLYLGDLA